MPSKAGASAEGPTLVLPELSFDDEGVYECEAYNSEGSDTYQGRISVQGEEKMFCELPFILKLRTCFFEQVFISLRHLKRVSFLLLRPLQLSLSGCR